MAGSLVLATRSVGKLRELNDLFRNGGHSIVTLDELGIETTADEEFVEREETFEGNALAKARYFAELLQRPVVADDSGLEVLALGNRPGVLSKRWSGRPDLSGNDLDAANNAHLIGEMGFLTDRRVRYVCVAAYCSNGVEECFRGETDGVILCEPRGMGGFGYDPYFFSWELGKTFAEATLAEKQRVSHRARAFRALLAAIDGSG